MSDFNENMGFETELDSNIETIDEITLISKVVLYNDEWHTFDEVIFQIIKATGYTPQKAEKITIEVHEKGKAIVYSGEMIKCITISSVLEEISLITEIEV